MEALGFSPRVSELIAGITEVRGFNSIIREVGTVGFFVLAVQESLKVFEGQRGPVQTSASKGGAWQCSQLELGGRRDKTACAGRTGLQEPWW